MFKNSTLSRVGHLGLAHQTNAHFNKPKTSPMVHVKLDQIGLVMNCDAPREDRRWRWSLVLAWGPFVFTRGRCAQFGQCGFFFKFITEPIEIGFLIIRTDAQHLRSVFRPIAVRFLTVNLIGLFGLRLLKKKIIQDFKQIQTVQAKYQFTNLFKTTSTYELLFIY